MPQSLEFPALNLLLLVCSIIRPILAPVSAHVNPICPSRTSSESLFHENFHDPPLGSNLSFLWKFNSTLFMMYSGPLNNMSLNCTSTWTWIFFSRKYYSTTWFTVGEIREGRTTDRKNDIHGAPCIRSHMYKLQVDFLTVQNQQPPSPVVQGSTIYGFIFLGGLYCMTWGILAPQSGVKPVPPAVKVCSPNHWTTREISNCILLYV